MASAQTPTKRKVAAKKPTTRKSTAKSAKKGTDVLAERRRLAALVRGKYSWIPYSVKDFIQDKRREIALENRA